jgi:hypothetical protein
VRLTYKDAAHVQAVDLSLDRHIAHRHDQRVLDQGERAVEEVWQEQERRAREEQQRLNRVRWASYHRAQAERLRRTLEPLVAFHEARAARLETEVS